MTKLLADKGPNDDLDPATEGQWLDQGRSLMLQGDLVGAIATFSAAEKKFPASDEIRIGIAGLYWHMRQREKAETLLVDWLTEHPGNVPATFLLASLLVEQGRVKAAAKSIWRMFELGRLDTDTVIQAIEVLDDYGQTKDAAAVCNAQITAGSTDPRIYAYAGMLGIQLGQFELVRQYYSFALAHSDQAIEWNIPIGLATIQRYKNSDHPDFKLFKEVLGHPGLSDFARMNTLFALGKAYGDIADYAQSANYLRDANEIASTTSSWSRKRWQRSIEARLGSRPFSFELPAPENWTPIFIVGVPRSGTTLLAELISRYPSVSNRGELGWLQVVATRLSGIRINQRTSFEEAASLYAMQLRQDDSESRWFIDKQPLNLLHIDLIMTMWPNARIIHCKRNPRDTALSLWSQSFQDHAHDYAYEFKNIGAVIHGCDRLMAHWKQRYSNSIRTIAYEALVSAPHSVVTELAGWLGFIAEKSPPRNDESRGISTASAWQARQPVHTQSVGRWRDYSAYVPELMQVAEH